MITASRVLRVWACPFPVDMRNGFNGLYGLVTQALRRDPLSGEYFLFVNPRRTTAKVLLWDGTGLCIYQKRLARGRFAKLWPDSPGQPLQLTTAELALFLEGATLAQKLPLSPPEITF